MRRMPGTQDLMKEMESIPAAIPEFRIHVVPEVGEIRG